MMPMRRSVLVLFTILAFSMPALASGQTGAGQAAAAPAGAAAGQGQVAPEDDPDLDIDPLQPDFTLITLPTTLRMPRMKSSFRVTHRFLRSLGQGDFGSLVEDFFGIDSGAAIGLEYRFGLMRGTYVGIRRTNNRTIEFQAEHNLMSQRNSRPVGLSAFASIDGTNNFRDSYTPALGVAISRTLGAAGTVYVDPMWVNNTNPLPSQLADDNNTFLVGLGTRLRIRPSVYLVGEIIPRVAGFDPGVNHASFGIEKLLGGHVFQLNFSNGFGTTMGQIARGGTSNDDWYLGFNISRKFY
ncbi:MAG TPA: DUF5777 family beta-barrel protein [Vicinamibacterales bacterium]|nr:DUF5777 family beta-barrel protein [Vicinamibacterales bacterium]